MSNGLNSEIMSDLFGDEQRVVRISDLTLDTKLQPRTDLDMEHVEEMAERMSVESGKVVDRHGEAFDPLRLVETDDGSLLVWDGFHRVQAARNAGIKHFQSEVTPGEWGDAFRLSLGANYSHGKRRTRADKRRAAWKALTDDEFKKLSDTQIAEITKLSQSFVSKVRRELMRTDWYDAPETRIDSKGREYDPTNIGAKATAGPALPRKRTRSDEGETVVNLPERKDTRDGEHGAPSESETHERSSDSFAGINSFVGSMGDGLGKMTGGCADLVLTRGAGHPKRLHIWDQAAHAANHLLTGDGLAAAFTRPDLLDKVVRIYERQALRVAWVLSVNFAGAPDRDNEHGVASSTDLVAVFTRPNEKLSKGLPDNFTTNRTEHGYKEVTRLIVEHLGVTGFAVDPVAGQGGLAAGAVAAGMEVMAIFKSEDDEKVAQALTEG